MNRDLLVKNLKALNAKERDHLMRFAYLGATGAYEGQDKWLSLAMQRALRTEAGLSKSAKCIFAGMDYHLDWLFGALFLTCNPEWAGSDSDPEPLDDDVHGADRPAQITLDSLRPVIGIQEDVDLLVVFADNNDVIILCIEAKGDDAFGRVQLGRKLIRLDRILKASGANKHEELKCKLLLIAPKKPDFDDCLTFVRSMRGHKTMCDYLEGQDAVLGKGLHFIELKGFPKDLRKVTRKRDPKAADSTSKVFTHWTITKR